MFFLNVCRLILESVFDENIESPKHTSIRDVKFRNGTFIYYPSPSYHRKKSIYRILTNNVRVTDLHIIHVLHGMPCKQGLLIFRLSIV